MSFGLSDDTIQKMSGVFTQYQQIEEVIIYGSRAKGNFREGSDIDLCLIGDFLSEEICSRVWLGLDDLDLVYLIDLSLRKSLSSESLLHHIDRVGKFFYRKTQTLEKSESN